MFLRLLAYLASFNQTVLRSQYLWSLTGMHSFLSKINTAPFAACSRAFTNDFPHASALNREKKDYIYFTYLANSTIQLTVDVRFR